MIDIHELHRGKVGELLYSISDARFSALKRGIIEFERLSGITIDQYGDTKLSSGLHVLITSFKNVIGEMSEDDQIICEELVRKMESWNNEKVNVVFVGD